MIFITFFVDKTWKSSRFPNIIPKTLKFLNLKLKAMKRDIYKQLLDWKRDQRRKPLILRGARQVGKTYILNEFAKEYANNLYINFEKMPSVADRKSVV